MGLLLCAPHSGITICNCGRLQHGKTKATLEAYVENIEENVDLEDFTPLLDQVYLGCSQPKCKTNKRAVE